MVTRSGLAAGKDGKWDQLPSSPVFIWNSSPTKEGEGAGGGVARSLPQMRTAKPRFPPSRGVFFPSAYLEVEKSDQELGITVCLHCWAHCKYYSLSPNSWCEVASVSPLLQTGRPRHRPPCAVVQGWVHGQSCPTPQQEPPPGSVFDSHPGFTH